jgi:hypothetical protein
VVYATCTFTHESQSQDESSGCIIAGIFPSNFVETIGENSNIGTGAGVVQTSTGSIEGTKEDVVCCCVLAYRIPVAET